MAKQKMLQQFRKIQFLLGTLIIINIIGIFILTPIESPIEQHLIEIPTPNKHINHNAITLEDNKLTIEHPNLEITGFLGSNSMLPTFNSNCIGIWTYNFSFYELTIGDIITYEIDKDSISHRIIRMGKDRYDFYVITKGDNNFYEDDKVYRNQITKLWLGEIC